MTKKTKIAVVSISALALIVTAAALNPLRKPEKKIEAALLEVTPIGSKASDVRSIVEQKGWLDQKYSGTTGFLKQEIGKQVQTVGKTSIRGHLGAYRGFPVQLCTDVTAFWAFDEESRLVDVWVWKTTDAP